MIKKTDAKQPKKVRKCILKLEAEAAYVKSTDITMDNAMDNLLYADAKNCALLKEAVMNFLAENSAEAYEKISFDDRTSTFTDRYLYLKHCAIL